MVKVENSMTVSYKTVVTSDHDEMSISVTESGHIHISVGKFMLIDPDGVRAVIEALQEAISYAERRRSQGPPRIIG